MVIFKNNWRSKNDPAFDKAVRNYVTTLEGIENSPSEGTLNLPEDFIGKSLLKHPDWQNLDEPMDEKSLFKFASKAGILDDKDVHLIADFTNSIDDSEKILKLSF